MTTRLHKRSTWVLTAMTFVLSSCTGLNVVSPTRSLRADPEAQEGGTITIGIQAPASIDPATVSDPGGALVASLVCEPLVQIDPATGELVPGLIENVVTGRNGSVFTIRLRDDVQFHNGATLTAPDIVYSLSRAARHDIAAPQADVLSSIAGYELIHAALPPTENIDPSERTLLGVRAISSSALEIGLQEPNAEYLRAFSLTLAAPVPEGLPDESATFGEQPICVGPYRLARPYRPGDPTIELEKFAGYYGENSAFTRGGAGYPETIVFRIEADAEAELRDLRAGRVDVVHVPTEELPDARRMYGRFMTSSVPQIEFVGLPTGKSPFDDARIRVLLSRAIDRRRLVTKVFSGGRVPADRIIPPSIAGSPTPEICTTNVPLAGTTERPDRRLVATLRQEPYVFKVNADFDNRALAEEIAGQWRKKLGLDIDVVPVPWSDYLTEVTSAHGITTIFRESWAPPYPSIDAVLHPLFHSSQIGTNNWSRFSDLSFDRRLERLARREATDQLRRLQYIALEETLCAQVPMIPLTFGQDEYVVRTGKIGSATGEFFDTTTGQPLLRELYVRRPTTRTRG